MNIDYSYWFPILLTLLPILYGVIRVLYIRLRKIRNRALLFENIESKQYVYTKNDQIELRVLYNRKISYDALVILKARIKNIGREDLSSSILIDPINLSCNEKYSIVDARVVNQYEKIKPEISFDENNVKLSWALLKHDCDIEIQIIAQILDVKITAKPAFVFFNELVVDINADGIDNVDKPIELTRSQKKNRVAILVLIGYLIFSIIGGVANYFVIQRKNYYDLEFNCNVDSSKANIYTIAYQPTKDSVVLVVDDNKLFFSIEEFNRCVNINNISSVENVKRVFIKEQKRTIIPYIIIFVLIIILLLIMILKYKRNK